MESSINKGINYGIPLGVHRPVEQSIPPVLYPVGVGYKKFEAIKNISSFKFRNQKSRTLDLHFEK
ncbi:MAG: hypothetical protein LBQ01_09520 [Prevotellaceae bacterium]|jgi:hypothetical protein|nr:hypothetical protein [Prevotellaceae bacterium]